MKIKTVMKTETKFYLTDDELKIMFEARDIVDKLLSYIDKREICGRWNKETLKDLSNDISLFVGDSLMEEFCDE